MNSHLIYDKFLIYGNKFVIHSEFLYNLLIHEIPHQSSHLNRLFTLLVQNSTIQILDLFFPPKAPTYSEFESRGLAVLGLKTNKHKPCNLNFETSILHQSKKKYKVLQITNVGKDVEEREPFVHCW